MAPPRSAGGGRKPKSNTLRKLEGDRSNNKSKYKNVDEMDVDASYPTPPASVKADEDAMWVWADLKKRIENAGAVRITDVYLLEMVCLTIAEWRRVGAILQDAKEQGTYIRETMDGKGNMIHKKHPSIDIYNSLFTQMKSLLNELGLTPASRMRIAADMGEPDSGSQMQKLFEKK